MSTEWADQPQGASSSGASPESHSGAGGAPGKILAAQREAMGWTVEQVADQLKLAVRQVVALEAGDSSALPGPAVVRGFVRAYAKIVRLDPVPLVAQIPLDSPGPSDASHTSLRHARPASFSEVRFPSHGKRSSVPVVPIIAIVVIAAAAFAAWHFGLVSKITGKGETATTSSSVAAPSTAAGSTSSSSSTVLAPAASVAAPATTVSAPLPNLQNPSVPLISVPPPSAVTPGSPASAPVAAAVPAATAVAAPAAGANTLVLTTQKDAWIQVKPARGAPLLSRLVKAGSTETVEVTEPVTLTVGNPDGVSATLRGTAVALPVTRSGAVAKVELK